MEPDAQRHAVRWAVGKRHNGAYFTRREIDTEGNCAVVALEMLWLRSAIDGFFLHVQGSGLIKLATGQSHASEI